MRVILTVNEEDEMINRVWALFLAVMLAVCALPAMAEETARDRYHLDIAVLEDEQAARIVQTVDYTNRTGSAQTGMLFCVYANVLRRQSAVPVEAEQMNDAFPAGYAPGGVDFIQISLNGEPAEWGMQGEKELFLRVGCDLEPGESARFEFEYYLLLPAYSGAMGVGDLTWRLTNFYPVAAVYDPYLEDFPLNDYTVVNEPLFSEAADYTASISLPETYALAAPGDVTAVPDGEGMVDYEIRAEGVRQLALIFSRKMTGRVGMTDGGTQVRALANTASDAQAMLDSTLPVMNWLEQTFGEYPWPCLTVIETEYVYDGLAYPGVIQVSDSLTGLTRRDALDQALVSLCADQYFGCIVGSNPGGAPWLSDAVSSFVSLLYYEAKNGYDDYLVRLNKQVLAALQTTIPGGLTVDSEAERFNSRMEYEIVVIDRGTAVLHEMRQAMGADVFMEALAEYAGRMRSKNATATDFLAAMNDVSGRRWDEYLYGQMHTIDEYVSMNLEWYE